MSPGLKVLLGGEASLEVGHLGMTWKGMSLSSAFSFPPTVFSRCHGWISFPLQCPSAMLFLPESQPAMD